MPSDASRRKTALPPPVAKARLAVSDRVALNTAELHAAIAAGDEGLTRRLAAVSNPLEPVGGLTALEVAVASDSPGCIAGLIAAWPLALIGESAGRARARAAELGRASCLDALA